MKTVLKILTFSILLLLGYRCVPAIIESEKNNVVVVEAYLFPNKPVRVKLKKAVSYSNNQNREESLDSIGVIFSSQQKSYAMKSVGRGFYVLADDYQVKAGELYKLKFEYLGRPITAETTVPHSPERFSKSLDSIQLKPVTLVDKIGDQLKDNTSIRLTWANLDNAYHYVVISNVEKKPIPIVTAPTGQNINPFAFTSKPTQTNTIDINAAQFQYFGLHQIVLLRVTSDYAKLYNSGYNGQSSQYMSVATSSVKNGLGLFAGLSADTLFFKVVRK